MGAGVTCVGIPLAALAITAAVLACRAMTSSFFAACEVVPKRLLKMMETWLVAQPMSPVSAAHDSVLASPAFHICTPMMVATKMMSIPTNIKAA